MNQGKVYYFAYGSNMNPDRMKARGVRFFERKRGILKGWKLVFNKVASRNPREGYANIIRDEGSVVEGVLYLIEDEGIKNLDLYEGYPDHYDRKFLEVETESGEEVRAIVYIAQPDKTKEGLKPSKEYLMHLLKGCDLLSQEYCEKLKNVEVI